MRKLIHSKFELDLSPFKISDTEENNWFSDSYFTKYSFPFEIDLTIDWDVTFDFISCYNTNPQTYYELKYFDNEKIEDAVFVIESQKEKLSCVLRFGLEQFPNWDTKLAELPLEKFYLPTGTTIYQHAETIISQVWPAVNYNFPQIHIDFDADDEGYSGFQGILNNRKSGAFLTNTVEPDPEDVTFQLSISRNIIQPLPYLLYILQQGFAQAGYTLVGDITNDDLLKKATVYSGRQYFVRIDNSDIQLIAPRNSEYKSSNTINGNLVAFYQNKIVLKQKGRYKIRGNYYAVNTTPGSNVYLKIKYRDAVIYEINVPWWIPWGNQAIDINFDTARDFLEDELTFEVFQKIPSLDFYVYTLWAEKIGSTDSDGFLENSIINESKIDLTRAVADITFGDFINVLKNWFNYDLTIEGNQAIMNKIESQMNYDNALDFQFTEVKYPAIKYNQNLSFLLKFQDIENTAYSFKAVFQNLKGIFNTGYKTDENTKTIEIKALPLPLKTANGSTTGYALEASDSKLFLAPYSGLTTGNNVTEDVTDYLIPAVHLSYWKKWFDFRIAAKSFNWTFTAFDVSIDKLKAKAKLYAYKNIHIIKTINKKEIKKGLFQLDLETDTLP